MKTRIRTILALAAMSLCFAGSAYAVPVTYTFSGNAGGYVNSVSDPFSGAFTFVVNGDTTAINTSGAPFFKLSNVNGTFTRGSFSATLTGVTVESNANPAFENIDFYNTTFLNGLGMSDPALNGYNLSTSIGPITVTTLSPAGSFLTPTFAGGGFTTTGSDTVFFTSNDSLTFTASTASVPEPSAVLLLGLGLVGIVIMRKRIRT